jgi:hypothetical protein
MRMQQWEKSDDSKDSFHKELRQVCNHFLKQRITILLWDFNTKLGSDDIFKPTIVNDSLHEDSTDNRVRAVNFVT